MSEEDHKASKNPLIVMVDEIIGEKYARAAGKKGLGENGEMQWLVKDMSNELKAWGHPGSDGNHLILKSDNEPAIVAVREALGRFHGGRIIPESPPKGESQSNGVIEEAGKTVREFTRVLKEQVEDKAKIKQNCDDVLVQWMTRWAAMLVSRYLVGKDGRTAYERRKGRTCRLPVLAFGETIWYKELRDKKSGAEKFSSDWREGVWLGHARASNEAVVGTPDGVVRAYAFKRQDEDNRWNGERLKTIKGTPGQPDPSK